MKTCLKLFSGNEDFFLVCKPFSFIILVLIILVLGINIPEVKAQERVYRKVFTYSSDRVAIGTSLKKHSQNDSLKSPIYLSMIFHILTPEGDESSISRNEVLAQLAALNRDFNGTALGSPNPELYGEFTSLAADMEISFCLARLDDQQNPLEAIRYYPSHKRSWPADHSIQLPDSGGISPVYPEKIINVWVADLDGDISGFSQMPGGPTATDGIAIDYRFFGTGDHTHPTYNEGKTLTHLMGNYLNLYPIWGKGESGSDDEVTDTPIHNAPNVGCPGPNHLSTEGNNVREMTANFMDNTDDACMNMFTHGQKERVYALFRPGGGREGLLTTEPSTLCQIESLVQAYGIDDMEKVEVFPNPATNSFSVKANISGNSIHSIMVFNSFGELIYEAQPPTHMTGMEYQINCEGWGSGIYVLQLITSQRTITKKLLIK